MHTRCAACPVARGPCAAASHPRYCELAAAGDPFYLDRIRIRSAESPPAAPSPAPVPPTPAIRPGLADPLDQWAYVTTDQLARDALLLLPELPEDLDLVVSVARSGLIPGAILASQLHLPMRTVSRSAGEVRDPGSGFRMEGRPESPPRRVLLIDDTAASGREMEACAPIVRAAYPGADLIRAVIYAHPNAAAKVDLYARLYPGWHYLAWNWQNAGHGEKCGFDFDGILVRDDDPRQRPLYLPRRKAVPLICTGRHESARGITEAWLDRWGVRCDRLVMRDFGAPLDFSGTAEFKATVYRESDCRLFAESDPGQAETIARLSGKPCLCPALGKVFPGRSIRDEADLGRRARACPHRSCDVGCNKARCGPGGKRPGEVLYLSDCKLCIAQGGD